MPETLCSMLVKKTQTQDPNNPNRDLSMGEMYKEMEEWTPRTFHVNLSDISDEHRCNGLRQRNPGCTSGKCWFLGYTPCSENSWVGFPTVKVPKSCAVLKDSSSFGEPGNTLYFTGPGRCNITQEDLDREAEATRQTNGKNGAGQTNGVNGVNGTHLTNGVTGG